MRWIKLYWKFYYIYSLAINKTIPVQLIYDKTVKIDIRSAYLGGSYFWGPPGKKRLVYPNDKFLLEFVYNRLKNKKRPILLDIGANTRSFTLLPKFIPNLDVYGIEPINSILKVLASVKIPINCFNLALVK